jgi:signal transduction histidine kinase
VRNELVEPPRGTTVDRSDAELRHETRAALLGIEAAASALLHHRALLTVQQLDELSGGLVAEVQRLRALLDDPSPAPVSFDLLEAITPVLTCARANGLDVRSTVPPGIAVTGRPESTAQVMVALLTNVKRHAPGSPVDVAVSVADDTVLVSIDDRGPGVPAFVQERVFERHAQAVGQDGSGLGLCIARRLMEEQVGSIAVLPRVGGGSSFVLGFRRAQDHATDGDPSLSTPTSPGVTS